MLQYTSMIKTLDLRELAQREGVVTLSLDQYVQMIETGILPEGEPIELLDGFLVRKDRAKEGENPMTVGFDHIWVVENLKTVLAEVPKYGCHLRTQQPLAIPPDGAPEPDGAIVKGTIDDYRNRYPGAADASCVIEVADSSRQRDRVTKKRIYAQGGVTQYVVIDLVGRFVEVCEEPLPAEGRFAREEARRGEERVRFAVGNIEIFVQANQLLPQYA